MRVIRLKKDAMLTILNRNFGFEIYDDDIFGEVILMSPRDAYIYSAITGSEYLSDPDPVLHFSPKGLQSVFAQCCSYELSTGLFICNNNEFSFHNTTSRFAQSKPFIKFEEKYIVPLEVSSPDYLSLKSAIYKKLIEAGKKPSNYIITPIKTDIIGFGMESFLEYIVCRYFRDKGYITENQIPLQYGIGRPDVGAFYLPEILDKLKRKGFVDTGAFLLELASISVFGKSTRGVGQIHQDVDLIIGEAKATLATVQLERQLDKYSSTGIFDEYYRVLPSFIRDRSKYGLITFDAHGTIISTKGRVAFAKNDVIRGRYVNWMENYWKFYLITNLPWTYFCDFMYRETGITQFTKRSVINTIKKLEFEQILNVINLYIQKERPIT